MERRKFIKMTSLTAGALAMNQLAGPFAGGSSDKESKTPCLPRRAYGKTGIERRIENIDRPEEKLVRHREQGCRFPPGHMVRGAQPAPIDPSDDQPCGKDARSHHDHGRVPRMLRHGRVED